MRCRIDIQAAAGCQPLLPALVPQRYDRNRRSEHVARYPAQELKLPVCGRVRTIQSDMESGAVTLACRNRDARSRDAFLI